MCHAYRTQIASGAANTTIAASIAKPSELLAPATSGGAISAASASGPPNEATAPALNPHGPISRRDRRRLLPQLGR
jgi:hypothetical protein